MARTYIPTFGEEVGNSVSHGVMSLVVLVATPFAAIWSFYRSGGSLVAASSVSVFCVSIFLMFLISTLYHAMSPDSRHKEVFHILDHIFIYVAIAGSYTPVALVIIGGLGFFVWEDILQNRCWKKLTLYSKLVLAITAFLLIGGTLFFMVAEGGNPATLGGMDTGEKWLNAFFQSVTLRTAGFNVIDQGAMTDNSIVMSCILMLIGGSSGSTAGGMKTVTVWVLFMVVLNSLRGRESIVYRGRTLPLRRAMNAITLFLMVSFLFFTGSMLISVTHEATFLQAAYETASALGTVGLTTGITPHLTWPAQALLIVLMYAGRVGILSFSIAFLNRRKDSLHIKYPAFSVMIG